MKKLTPLIFAVFFCFPAQADESYSLYLVRHAEKQNDQENPSLTQCGQLRAKQLASMLELTDIEAVYSTSYQRTMQTATPTAKKFELAIKNYAPNRLEQLAHQLKQAKKNTLVVGHSNTTPQLARILSEEEVAPIPETEYQMLYQIQIDGAGKKLTLLKQPLLCK